MTARKREFFSLALTAVNYVIVSNYVARDNNVVELGVTTVPGLASSLIILVLLGHETLAVLNFPYFYKLISVVLLGVSYHRA